MGVRGALQRERLRQLMAQKPGTISKAVAKNTGRRMGVEVTGDSPAPDPMLYLERFGGCDRQKHLGLLAWLAGGILDQANMDQGSFDLAWLLTLEEEPPGQVLARAPAPTTAMGRALLRSPPSGGPPSRWPS